MILKDETQNPIRSFKGRGAVFFIDELRDPPSRVVCGSAGNFGQALAYAAARRGIGCDVFAATTANPLKIERMRVLGATVHLVGADFDAAKDAGRAYAARLGAPFIEDGREVRISEGAGSTGVELLDPTTGPDIVVAPLGNGALLAGLGAWIRHMRPATRVVGVCSATAPATERSWRAGRRIVTEQAPTIADGIAVRVPIQEALDDLAAVVDEIVLVTDAELVRAMRFVHAAHRLTLEPAGAAGVAALMAERIDCRGASVATLLTGGNVTPEQHALWLA